MLDLRLIIETKKLIDSYVLETPLSLSNTLSSKNRKVYFKNEGLQPTRSFKMRGAFSKMLRLSDEEKSNGVVAVSSGNHGVAVSYAAKMLGIEKALIFVPENTPDSKIDTIRHYGAELIVKGKSYDEAHAIGMAYVKDHQMTYIDAYDKDPLIYAGQGTAGLEILRQNPNIDTILAPIGGGGLISGISTAAKTINLKIKVIGVQTEACPAMKASMDEKHFYPEYPSDESVCEALIGGVGELAYNLADELIDDIIIVKEESIIKALKHMILEERTIIEASSCVVVAALMEHADYDFGKEVALLLSGNNIDVELMKKVIND
ncbi:threonine/serine dehydratase [Acidaminobacter sp. JC074]|uniref:threonine/serine dehydratase n=1 Tax=Acidaminobacter sp. JC074 TaxID=2530199 RepID=UPI001F10EEDC|nr:threonine/serine dehydratase [Acidaminobacter sp. JC074]MCH4886970.1 threonine/serine dehydratase [Acidaminobacter sp. JC074]